MKVTIKKEEKKQLTLKDVKSGQYFETKFYTKGIRIECSPNYKHSTGPIGFMFWDLDMNAINSYDPAALEQEVTVIRDVEEIVLK